MKRRCPLAAVTGRSLVMPNSFFDGIANSVMLTLRSVDSGPPACRY